jgi:hypothetical protein
MAVRYYVKVHLGDTEPSGLYRFFDEDRLPECYKKGIGWVPRSELYAYLASGEVGKRDEISPEKAAEVVDRWGGTL